MHEVSLVAAIVAQIEAERRTQFFSRVQVVRLKVGALGHAEPSALRFCFDAVAGGTIADGARLEIEIVPGAGWCDRCRQTVMVAERYALCPDCGEAGIVLTAGGDLQLAELEVA